MRRTSPMLLLAAVVMPGAAHAQATFTGLGLVPGAAACYARFVSPDGLTASGYCFLDQEFTNHAFRWRSGSIQDLGIPEGYFSSEGGPLNADGSIMAVILGLGQRPGRWTESTGTMVDLGFPANTNHLPLSISADGATIWGFGGSSPVSPRVYRWTAATSLQYLSLPPGYTASAGGRASANGNIVVGSVFAASGPRPVRWVAGVPTVLTLPAGMTEGDAAAVSADGQVITGAMTDGGGNRHMFRWTQAGGFQDLGGELARGLDINADGSVIVGWTAPGGFTRAMRWTSTTGLVDLNVHLSSLGIDLSAWTLDAANAVSADGRTILGQGTHNGVQEAWIATLPAACYANCDGSSGNPRLTPNDFQCFLDAYAAGTSYANCDGIAGLTGNDFQCFMDKYVAGCS